MQKEKSVWAWLGSVSANDFVCVVLQVWFVLLLSCSGASSQVLLQALHSEPAIGIIPVFLQYFIYCCTLQPLLPGLKGLVTSSSPLPFGF